MSCALFPRSQARQLAICGCAPSPPPMLPSLIECDHIYSAPKISPLPARRCSEACSALKLLFAVLPLFVDAAEIRQWTRFRNRIDVVNILAREEMDPRTADVSDLTDRAAAQLALDGQAPLNRVQITAIPLERSGRDADVSG